MRATPHFISARVKAAELTAWLTAAANTFHAAT